MFPNASQSTIAVNPHLCAPDANKTPSRPSVGAGNGKMTGVEAEFALILEAKKAKGQFRDYLFHPLSLPWAGMKYSPDFMVTPNSGLEKRRMIEVKGSHIHYRQQAIARFKGCRAYWPEFEFEMWQLKKGQGWKRIY